eukprot:CAMPEP_0117623062 /NCGR_PEP_ID=MMETSP0784-20121206/88457_1 /TAXON_ID=39447 /ORGANISM="" /LENGTH=381 /DNA_ID=CAMNT_0005427009 /DNA_START=28 /DNA_END=1169 /DNA_ORIENTATION=+
MMWGVAASNQEAPKRRQDVEDVPGKSISPVVGATLVGHVASEGSAVPAGMRALRERGQFCDMVFTVNGRSFPAHRAILAALSDSFRKYLASLTPSADGCAADKDDPMAGMLSCPAPPVVAEALEAPAGTADAAPQTTERAASGADSAGTTTEAAAGAPSESAAESAGAQAAQTPVKKDEATPTLHEQAERRLELLVQGIKCPQALEILLAYVYAAGTGAAWQYEPVTQEVNIDVLRLSRRFGFMFLHECAARWLVKGLTTENVVKRLVVCKEFELGRVRDKIVEQIASKPAVLATVSGSESIRSQPWVLQDLLVQVACAPAEAPPAEGLPRDGAHAGSEAIGASAAPAPSATVSATAAATVAAAPASAPEKKRAASSLSPR